MTDPPSRRPFALATSAGEAELVADLLWQAGASAVSEEPLGDGRVLLVADPRPDRAAALGLVGRLLPEPDVDPLDAWREHAQVWRAGRFVVRPPWIDAAVAPDEFDLVVDPGHAFGSGSHPTTRLCLLLLDALVRPGDRVLDVGCGSGILGVGALLAGAARLVAIDVDPAAVAATEASIERHGLAELAVVAGGSVDEVADTVDLVLANVPLPVVESCADALVARLAPGGTAIVSGMLDHQVGSVRRALAMSARPATVTAQERLDDWVAVAVTYDDRP